MGRPINNFYTFIKDSSGLFYYRDFLPNGDVVIKSQTSPIPLKSNPSNLLTVKFQFGTNREYSTLARSLSYQLEFEDDGADILRWFDYSLYGYDSEAYCIIIRYNATTGIYELYYKGKFDFKKKTDHVIKGYKINTIDDSSWGILSQNDSTKYSIDCNQYSANSVKVLLDGINLTSTKIMQTTQSELDCTSFGANMLVPVFVAAEDGDSFGDVPQQQTFTLFAETPQERMAANPQEYMYRVQYLKQVSVFCSDFKFAIKQTNSTGMGIAFYIYRSTDTLTPLNLPPERRLFYKYFYGAFPLTTYSFSFNQVFNLVDGERIILLCVFYDYEIISGKQINPQITFITSSVKIQTISKALPSTCFSLRPLDLLQRIFFKISGGKYNIYSNYYSQNNTRVATSAGSISQVSDSNIVTSFKDWFKSYDSIDYLAMKSVGDDIYIERAVDIYGRFINILDIGEISELQISYMEEMLFTQLTVGCNTSDYRRASGNLEFNCLSKFAVNNNSNIKNDIELISPYKKDCYGIEFKRIDAISGSTKDSPDDKTVYLIDIQNSIGQSTTEIGNFVNIEVNNEPLAPLIRFPRPNSYITNDKPRVSGVCQPNTTLNIYVDSVLDGSVTSNAQGYWFYNIQTAMESFYFDGTNTINTGSHTISATFTDLTGTYNSVPVTIDTTTTTPISITYPSSGDGIVNNKPLIYGKAQTGTVISLVLDGVALATVIADGSCNWSFQVVNPIYNGSHVLTASGTICNFDVDSNTSIPIITSFDDGFPIVDNMPLVYGVATPGAFVQLWLNYYTGTPIGSDTADANGNWSIQLVTTVKPGTSEIIVPIQNGANVISTDLEIKNTFIKVSGYLLNRPNYSVLTGVPDSVFNVELSNKRCINARKGYFASVFYQQQYNSLNFESCDKNATLYTELNGVAIDEDADVRVPDFGNPLFLPIKAKFKAFVPKTYNDLYELFKNVDGVHATYLGKDLYFHTIGSVSINDVSKDEQEWSLMFHPKTSLTDIKNLSKEKDFQIMKNGVYYSDYNTFHLVKYNFQQQSKYQNLGMYEEWFDDRNKYLFNPNFIQKIQQTEVIIVQIITNNVSGVLLNLHDCATGNVVASYNFVSVATPPIPAPDIVQETLIDFSTVAEGQYFITMAANGNYIGITEKFEVRALWEDTILIEASNSINKTGAMFSTGFVSKLRVDGFLSTIQPSVDIEQYDDDAGNSRNTFSIVAKKRDFFLGDAQGVPDYIYMKASKMITIDNILIEGERYTCLKGNKFEPIDKHKGNPLYSYKVEVAFYENLDGLTVDAQQGNFVDGVTLVVDAGAFGTGGSGLTYIDLK